MYLELIINKVLDLTSAKSPQKRPNRSYKIISKNIQLKALQLRIWAKTGEISLNRLYV